MAICNSLFFNSLYFKYSTLSKCNNKEKTTKRRHI